MTGPQATPGRLAYLLQCVRHEAQTGQNDALGALRRIRALTDPGAGDVPPPGGDLLSALAWYARPANWDCGLSRDGEAQDSPAMHDEGQRARAALGAPFPPDALSAAALADLDALIDANTDFWNRREDEEETVLARDAVREVLVDLRAIAGTLRAAQDPAGDIDTREDHAMVRALMPAMLSKLAQSRAKGRGGWADPQSCHVTFLWDLLVEHAHKANQDFVDVANLAGMLQWRLTHTPGDRARLAAHVRARAAAVTPDARLPLITDLETFAVDVVQHDDPCPMPHSWAAAMQQAARHLREDHARHAALAQALAAYDAAENACAAATDTPALRTAEAARRDATVALAAAARGTLGRP